MKRMKLFSQHTNRLFNIPIYCLALSASLLLHSCSNDDQLEPNSGQKSALTMDMRSVSANLLNNSQLYVFNTSGNFVKKQLNVFKSGDELTTNMNVGTWDLVLLSNTEDISGLITPPPPAGAMSSSPMWQTKLLPGGNFLSQAPAELRYAPIPNTLIQLNTQIRKTAELNRNVSKIRVILKSHTGFDPVAAGLSTSAYVELLDVPTTLNWEGKLYPTRDNPTVSPKPLREYLKFDASQKADPIDFIVPAHRGTDAFTAVGMPTDTTRHKLKLRACMLLNGVPFYGKGAVEIPFVPKVNRIVQVNLTFRGEPDTELDIKVTVKDWEPYINQDETFN